MEMDDGCWKITKEMTIAQVMRRRPCLHRVFSQLGLACPHCFGAEHETLEQAARTYNMDPDIIVNTLNVAALFIRDGDS
jgi:hybrid cluster-associated redox disulfide protein